MATYPKLAQAYATTAGATLYTGPSAGAIIRQIRAVTVGATPGAALSEYFRLAHGSSYTDNCILPWTLVAGDDMHPEDCFIGVPNGDIIKAQSYNADTRLVVTLYGVAL